MLSVEGQIKRIEVMNLKLTRRAVIPILALLLSWTASVAYGQEEHKAAPDIEGQDVDGQKFKLSDYRGKVVLIDFWGDW